jgi:hypothetical protein
MYANFHDGELHVWQDGAEVSHVTFTRELDTICQWHWGAYASGTVAEGVVYEDDNSLWKLEEPWTDWSVEPWFDGDVVICE